MTWRGQPPARPPAAAGPDTRGLARNKSTGERPLRHSRVESAGADALPHRQPLRRGSTLAPPHLGWRALAAGLWLAALATCTQHSLALPLDQAEVEGETPAVPVGGKPEPAAAEDSTLPSCHIFKEIGPNHLSLNDIAVTARSDPHRACIRARFSLAIRVEIPPENTIITPADPNGLPEPPELGAGAKRTPLGWVTLDKVSSVEDTCPDPADLSPVEGRPEPSPKVQAQPPPPSPPSRLAPAEAGRLANSTGALCDNGELDMTVTFECGKLNFKFRRTAEFYYVSSIEGIVNLDPVTTAEFRVQRPMFLTSDLNHHFKFDDLIHVESSAEPKAFILSADFYNSQFEAFRNTSSMDFYREPDANSAPFMK